MYKCLNTLIKNINSDSGNNLDVTSNNKEQQQEPTQKSCSFIIQKYIESPLLVDKRKFDIRMWVLVTQDQKLYVFKEGYIRTTGTKFTLENQGDEVHLTNHAV